jgi:hypothetical protein
MAKNTKAADVEETKFEESQIPEAGTSFLSDDDKTEQMLGFPAYWSPSEEKNAKGNHGVIFATLVGQDDSDPDFVRWIFKAEHKTPCARGPVNNQERVIVEPDQFFSIAHAVQLRLTPYLGFKIQLTFKEKVAIKGGKTMWQIRLDTDKETAKQLTERRMALIKGQLEPKSNAAA